MTDWKYRWVCPHWEFFFYQEDAPDLPFSERNNEGAATFLDILNTHSHNVSVRVDFYGLDGKKDGRFGLEGVVSKKAVWAYRTDTGPNFPKPAPGQTVSAQGWFEIRATEAVYLAAYVTASKYTARARAWGFCLPIYERPYSAPSRAKAISASAAEPVSGGAPCPAAAAREGGRSTPSWSLRTAFGHVPNCRRW